MRFLSKVSPFFLLLASRAAAGPVETAIVAAMKLPEAPNYTWHTEVADDARTYDVSGVTERATDYSIVTMPMALSSSRRGPRGPGPRATASRETTVTAVFRGAEKSVVQMEDGWRKPEDLRAMSERGDGRRGGGFGGPPMGGFPRGPSRRGSGRTPGGEEAGNGTGYSNLQNTISRPHEELAIIVAGAADLKAEGDVIAGTLNETAAKLLLVHAGQKDITPLRASGTCRLWVKNGALVKYETKLEGVLAVEGRDGRREVNVHQTATTTLSEVGTSKVEVPAEAKKKLEG